MRDLIDERNRREKLKNSIIKGYNVHYVTQEELARQKEEEERKRQQEAAERLRLEEAAKKVALELERRREMEQRELLEQAKMPPSSRYGTNETDKSGNQRADQCDLSGEATEIGQGDS